ncbi:hypothetical protein H6G33_10705 [Calothrix sp. FACHB-1219]|uniref:hypothetical protein n=1 Tax=unclassified Calothrix TaxID=2619626 RepID=UPI00168589C7|nr:MULTISPECIES: hypothetical protein [unclassified Calothrix]MBD2201818.1 hypothetical protein [Calothrix sp. FACHB-168]MBD2217504.1 hypothetical protein [Calothrix sp. FACHB-1219]
MDELLQSFLSKLPTEDYGHPLELRGSRVNTKLKELRLRSLNVESSKLIGLAILLQNINSSLFTNEELEMVSRLRLDYFDTLQLPSASIVYNLSPYKSFHDTGSYRIYSLLDPQDISTASLQLGFASFNQYNVTSLREIVIALINRGV